MFPLDPEGGPEPDIIGTAGADRDRPSRWRYVVAGGVLALAGIVAAASLSSQGHHTAAGRPGGVTASPAEPTPASPAELAPPVPSAVPSQAWAASLNIANWPMPGSGSGGFYSSMFAGGVAGNSGWELTLRNVARSGQRCAAAVVLYGPDLHPIVAAYPLPARPASRTPAGDLAFVALGAGSPGVGVGFLQLAAPAGQAWVDPDRVGGLDISVPVLTMHVCGERYYLAGFAYPLAGTLDVFVTGHGTTPLHYLVPARLSRPRVSRVWESTG